MVCLLNQIAKRLEDAGHLTGTPNTITLSPLARFVGSAIGTLACIAIYFLSGIIFGLFSKATSILPNSMNSPTKTKMFWNLAVVRGVYGTLATLGAIYERWFDEDLWTHVTLSRTVMSNLLIIMHTGFFVYECTTQVLFDIKFKTFNKALHVHHLISILASLISITYGVHHYYANTLTLLEMSTPFSCICYVLLQAKMADTFAWKANQLILVHLFHMRSVYEALNIYETWLNWDKFLLLPTAMIIVHVTGVFLSFFILTPLWTYRKTEQLFNKKDWNNANENDKTKIKTKNEQNVVKSKTN